VVATPKRSKTRESTEEISAVGTWKVRCHTVRDLVKVKDGKESAILAALEGSDVWCKLLGLDTPARTALTDPSGQEPGNNVVIYIPDNRWDLESTWRLEAEGKYESELPSRMH